MEFMKLERLKLAVYRLANGYSLLPFQFTINISNVCNRKCKFCPNFAPDLQDSFYLDWFRQQPKLMSYDKFADFLKRMGVFRKFIRQLSFTGRGDPGLHPDLLKFCQLANRYKIPCTITTNGDKLTYDIEHELRKLKYFHYVRVSLFDAEKAEYWLRRQQISPIRIEFQNETGKHLEGYEDGYISINNPGTEKYSTMPKDFVTESYCVAPYSFNTLNTDGSLVTCITFFEVGNVFEQSFWKVWNGGKMRRHRNKGLSMSIDPDLADCRNCGYFMRKEKYRKLNKYA